MDRYITAEDGLQRDALEALVGAWPEPFDVTRLEYGTVPERIAALDVLRRDGLAEPGEGPVARATAAARRAVHLQSR